MTKKLLTLIFVLFSCMQLNASITLHLPPPGIDDEELKKFSSWISVYDKDVRTKDHEIRDGAKYLNELVLSQSPYLAQHSTNPINWKPWSHELLSKAKKENKLIFLSIGYSTCHWCHVMRDESFTDISVAKEINADFYSIKVDREELPHVDEYYMRALQQVKGEAGWPITAIIDGDGLPVFIDSYISKEKLLKLLPRINQIWKHQPEFLLLAARKIDSLINQKVDVIEETNFDEDVFKLVNGKLISLLDKVHGGFSGEVKFPSEAMMLYILDQLKRSPNKKLENLLKLQLDKMLSGGIYDHVGGGFHRYSTDPTWLVPHFEKMLYNQAQLIMVYSLAYEHFHDSRYLQVVEQTTDFLLKDFFRKGKGFVSAFDADFSGEEGAYYLWNKEQLESLGIKNHEYEIYQLNESKKFGVLLTSSTDETRKKILTARKLRGEIYFDRKVITGWNALAIKALVFAGVSLKNGHYINQATSLSDQFWEQRFDTKTGYLDRTGYSLTTKTNVKYLEDYAHLADAFLTLYDYDGNSKWLERARLLSSYANEYFSDGDGRFSNVSDKDGSFASYKMSDSELISPAATMINVIFKLNKRLGLKKATDEFFKHVNQLISVVSTQSMNHLYSAFVLNGIKNGSQLNTRYFAAANGKLDLSCVNFDGTDCIKFEIKIKLKEGWHINSNQPLQDYLMATQLDVPAGFKVEYPESKVVTLGFQPEALSIFENNITIRIIKTGKNTGKQFLNLPLQACSDRVCLLPENLKFLM